jgi:predicted TIM-barrel fold metal-dependent hydrolase
VAEVLAETPLVDHHCHGVVTGTLDRAGFEDLATEAAVPAPAGTTYLDTQLGFALRRHCAPVLDLPVHAAPSAYLSRRAELGGEEVSRRLLRAAGIGSYLVETGYRGDEITGPADLAELAGADAHEVVRLEAVAEQVAATGVSAEGFAGAVADALQRAATYAVGLKSIAAYRYGLDLEAARPTAAEVQAAAGAWLAEAERTGQRRVSDPVLLRALLWAGVDTGLPIQLHVGYGDADVRLHRCNPLLLTDWLQAVQPFGTQILLLHCYPYHREAGYLAHVLPHVHCDVGLAVNYTGARSVAILAESLELTPFHKALFSSDAFGLAELHHLGAVLFRDGLAEVLDGWVADGAWSEPDAVRVATMIGRGNAERVYGLAD